MKSIESWRQVQFNLGPPFGLPTDLAIISSSGVPCPSFTTTEEYKKSRYAINKINHLEMGLLPNPFGGDILNTQVLLLMLGPGFTDSELNFESSNPGFKNAIIRSIHQTNDKDRFPFNALNPQYSSHPGFIYWAERRIQTRQRAGNKFRQLATYITTKVTGIHTLDEAFEWLSKRIAVIEYFPYHAPKWDAKIAKLAPRLQSIQLLVDDLHNIIIPSVKQNHRLLICLRGPDKWNKGSQAIPRKEPNILVYPEWLRQSASLGLSSPGGKAILNALGL